MRALKSVVLRGWVALAVAVAAGGPALAQKVLAARVNGVGIPLELLDRQFEELLRERRLQIARLSNPTAAKNLKREALDTLIRIELLWQQARAAGLAASDAEVDRAVAEARARFRTPEAFLRRIEQAGFSAEAYREHTRKLLSGDRYAETVVAREVSVTEQDLADFFEANPRLFRRDEQVRVRHLLVAVPQDAAPGMREAARRRAEELVARVRGGESLETLARSHSDDPTRQWGGELDAFARGQMPKAFEDAAFALAPGAISEVVATPAGFHVIQLEQRIAAEALPLAAVRERIHDYLRATRGRAAIDREVEALRGAARIEMLTPL